MTRKELKNDAVGVINDRKKEKKMHENNIENLMECIGQLRRTLSVAYEKCCDANLASFSKSVLKDSRKDQCFKHSERLDSRFCAKSHDVSFVQRSRTCLREMDRVEGEENTMVESYLLHELPQLFPKGALLIELNRQLDNMVDELIQHEEQQHSLLLKRPMAFDEDDISVDSFESVPRIEEIVLENDDEGIDVDEKNCFACGTQFCRWISSIQYPQLLSRREKLTHLILDIKRQRHESLSNVKAFGSVAGRKEAVFFQTDETLRLLHDATLDADHIDDELQLHRVDKELHDAYNSKKDKYIVTRALHKYECMMDTNDAICALEREQERLVAKLTAKEVISDVLNW